ncbi:hypothetical protein FACS189432_07790 [Bacteroidia bacterium]|nr:hypothetical protein FACS189432_07790 [Bacteroidia bacterium]
MDTSTKIMEIFESRAKKFVKMYESIEKETNSYEFEQTIRSELESLGHILYQEMIGASVSFCKRIFCERRNAGVGRWVHREIKVGTGRNAFG